MNWQPLTESTQLEDGLELLVYNLHNAVWFKVKVNARSRTFTIYGHHYFFDNFSHYCLIEAPKI